MQQFLENIIRPSQAGAAQKAERHLKRCVARTPI